jgi:hypothetical protein
MGRSKDMNRGPVHECLFHSTYVHDVRAGIVTLKGFLRTRFSENVFLKEVRLFTPEFLNGVSAYVIRVHSKLISRSATFDRMRHFRANFDSSFRFFCLIEGKMAGGILGSAPLHPFFAQVVHRYMSACSGILYPTLYASYSACKKPRQYTLSGA